MKVGDSLRTTGLVPRLRALAAQPVVLCLLLAVVTLAVYWPVRVFEFSGCDDPGYYFGNPRVLSGLSASNFAWAFTTGDMANWHPLTWLSLMLDAELFGATPGGPHLVNLLLHAGNTILVFLFLRRVARAYWRSAFVAGLFALHPVHVESVAWISERKDLLCAFFTLASLLAYGGYAERSAARRPGRGTCYAWSLIAFALALLSKPMAVTLPCLFLLLDFWPLKRWPRAALRRQAPASAPSLLFEKIPFFVLTAGVCIVTYAVQKQGRAVTSLAAFPLADRFENLFVAYVQYLVKILWPVNLAMPYPLPAHWPAFTVSVSALLFLGACGAALALARKQPLLFTGWFWFVGMLVPVIGLVQVGTQSMADRYVYLPVVGLLVIIVWDFAWLTRRYRMVIGLAGAVAFAFLAASAFQTRAQLAYWENDGLLFAHTLEVTGPNYSASMNLGAWLSKIGRPQEALIQYSTALGLTAGDAIALYNIGNSLFRLGRPDDAIAAYRQALRSDPQRPEVLDNLGLVLMKKNLLSEAVTNFEAALRVRPDYADAHNNLASARFKQGRFDDAISEFYLAVKLSPESSVFWTNLGDALVRVGNTQTAIDCYQHAAQLEPGNAKIISRLKALGAAPPP